MKKLTLLFWVGLNTFALARPGFRYKSSSGRQGHPSSGSLSAVGASNIDDRRPQKVDHFFPHRPSQGNKSSGSLSGGGASNIDIPRPYRRRRP